VVALLPVLTAVEGDELAPEVPDATPSRLRSVQYLSDEWIDALDVAARTDEVLGELAAHDGLVLQQVVRRPDGRETAFHIVLQGGSAAVRRGTAADASVTLTTDLDTAAAIARGELSARLAFLRGSLRIGGDVRVLMAHRDLLTRVGDVFAGVREQTTWP